MGALRDPNEARLATSARDSKQSARDPPRHPGDPKPTPGARPDRQAASERRALRIGPTVVQPRPRDDRRHRNSHREGRGAGPLDGVPIGHQSPAAPPESAEADTSRRPSIQRGPERPGVRRRCRARRSPRPRPTLAGRRRSTASATAKPVRIAIAGSIGSTYRLGRYDATSRVAIPNAIQPIAAPARARRPGSSDRQRATRRPIPSTEPTEQGRGHGDRAVGLAGVVDDALPDVDRRGRRRLDGPDAQDRVEHARLRDHDDRPCGSRRRDGPHGSDPPTTEPRHSPAGHHDADDDAGNGERRRWLRADGQGERGAGSHPSDDRAVGCV